MLNTSEEGRKKLQQRHKIRRNEGGKNQKKPKEKQDPTFSDVSQDVVTDVKVLEMLSSHQHVFGNDRHIVVRQV